jgi:hypothetical protein
VRAVVQEEKPNLIRAPPTLQAMLTRIRTCAGPVLRRVGNARRPLSTRQVGALKGYGTVLNIVAGAYVGGLAICCGSLYWMYHDANERQAVPFELSCANQVEAVKAINKDDVLRSPQYAEKHYRALLQSMSATEAPADDRFDFTMIEPQKLLYNKLSAFANFYIDMIIRYARALMARNQIEPSRRVLKKIIDSDDIFFNLGNAELLARACRLLAETEHDSRGTVRYLRRAIDMLKRTHPSIKIDDNYLLQPESRITNELLLCLNSLAFNYAKGWRQLGQPQGELLTQSLNIYLATFQKLKQIEDQTVATHTLTQRHFPLFDISPLNLTLQIAAVQAHISELIWTKGYRANAIGWSENVVELVFDHYNETSKAAPILIGALQNLVKMYGAVKDFTNRDRCQRMLKGLEVFEQDRQSWHDETLARFSKIIYNRGPLGIIEKALTERYGQNKPVPGLEEFDVLD